MKLQLIGHNLRDTNMKKLLLLLSLISFNAFATDRGVPCNSNNCKVKVVTKDSGGIDVTSLDISSTGITSNVQINGNGFAGGSSAISDGQNVYGKLFFRNNGTLSNLNYLTGGVSGQIIYICNTGSYVSTIINNGVGKQTIS